MYYTATSGDAFTQRMKRLPLTWRDAGRATPHQLAEMIRKDRIDIAVELSGHTIGHSLAAMALRPAPIGVTYLGYPNTTGVPGIDFRLVDAITDPPAAETFATERLLRLPGCFLCYRPDPDAPPPGPAPSLSGQHSPQQPGPVTFGSFNNLAKISDATVSLWTRVVNAVPDSRLLLKFAQADSDWLRNRFRERFAAAGLAPGRLEILGKIDAKAGHLAAYNRIDIALDPVPYAGTTTTCEALDMGVPVITLTGPLHAARVGASLLTAAGLTELVAATPDEYVEIARASPPITPQASKQARDEERSSPQVVCPGKSLRVTCPHAQQVLREECRVPDGDDGGEQRLRTDAGRTERLASGRVEGGCRLHVRRSLTRRVSDRMA